MVVRGSSMRSGSCLGVAVRELVRSSGVCTVGGVFFFLAMYFNGLEIILVSILGECEWSWCVVAGPSVRARVAGAERWTATRWDVVQCRAVPSHRGSRYTTSSVADNEWILRHITCGLNHYSGLCPNPNFGHQNWDGMLYPKGAEAGPRWDQADVL
jgi:hypothetical protein